MDGVPVVKAKGLSVKHLASDEHYANELKRLNDEGFSMGKRSWHMGGKRKTVEAKDKR